MRFHGRKVRNFHPAQIPAAIPTNPMEYDSKRLILERVESIKGPFSTDFSEGIVTKL